MEQVDNFILREARPDDIANIINLYYSAYEGAYPDKRFTQYPLLQKTIESSNCYIFVATKDEQLVSSILFQYDDINLLSKAGAAVVSPECRGNNLTQSLIKFGIEFLNKNTQGIEVLYITTRTVNRAAQVLTQKLGFKKLGIFPNVHKTTEYETHALAAYYSENAFEKRYVDFNQHPRVKPFFDIVKKECELPEQKFAESWNQKNYEGKVPKLEVIEAPEFVKYRISKLKEENEIDLGFFPFHEPSHLITSPDQNIEVFAYISDVDKYCVITGVKIDREVSFNDLFLKISNILRDRGVRYIEMIIRANRLNIIEKIMNSKFIPCGYFPAFQLDEGKRFDYVVFSRSFEIFDFNNLELTGVNQNFLQEYVKMWEEISIGSKFIKAGLAAQKESEGKKRD